MLTDEEKAKQRELQAQYGEDCAFFKTKELGFLAFVPPTDPATPYWAHHKVCRLDGSDKLGAEIDLALAFAHGSDEHKEKLAGLLRMKGAFGVKAATACKRICGSEEPQNPPLDIKSEAEELERLKKEHGDVVHYRVAGFGLLVVAAPTNPACFRQLYNYYNGNGSGEETRDIQEQFALDCVVYPERERVAALLQRKPALTKKLSISGQDLAGGEYDELGKA
jgi:hypothetical protein